MRKVSALRIVYDGIVNSIETPVVISNIINNNSVKTKGLWDTGATASVITKDTAESLGIKPLGFRNVRGVHGVKQVNYYAVKITLNNENITLEVEVTECESLSDGGETGMLIGMDIITMGDFAVSNFDGKTVMTFRVPSIKRFDFVEEIRENNKILSIHEAWLKQGNNKCPCGSGKLFKNCHGRE